MTGRPQNLALRSVRVIAGLMIVAGLYLAREILIPAALALLLTFLLHPPVRMLRRVGFSHLLAVITVVFAFSGLLAGVGVLVGEQMVDLSLKLPDYRQNLREKVRHLRPSGQGAFARLTGTIEELKKELTTQPSSAPAAIEAIAAEEPAPVRVEVVNQGPTISGIASSLVGPLMVPLIGIATTWLLLTFILIQMDELRARLATFAGMRRISLTTTAVNEIGTNVGRFFQMQMIVNLIYGIVLALGLAAFGVPQALLWGVIGFVLRFAPYVGPWTAAALPSLLAIAVFPGWSTPLSVIGMLVVLEAVTNLVLEPWLYGSRTGITSLGVVVASVFWAWVWGPMGLLLAVPMTVCLTGLGKYVPQLSLLNLLFGEGVKVSRSGQLYQDLLVGDAMAADRILDDELEKAPLPQVCDEILTPILVELKRDISVGVIEASQARRAVRTLESVVLAAVPMKRAVSSTRLVLISGQNEVDACAARLLAMCAGAQGIRVEVCSPNLLVSEAIETIRQTDISHLIIVQVVPVSVPHSRRLIKALLPKLPDEVAVTNLTVGDRGPVSLGEDVAAERVISANTYAEVMAPLAEQESIKTPVAAA